MLINMWDMLETNGYRGGSAWFQLPHWAGFAACSAALVSVPQEGGTAALRWTGAWGWLSWEQEMELLLLELMGASGSHATPHVSQHSQRTFTDNSSMNIYVSAVFSTSVRLTDFFSKRANSDPLGWPVSDRETGELSTLAGSENVKKTKQQTSKPMTRKDYEKKRHFGRLVINSTVQ